ncbi:MAG TPA: VOC family protein [Polyangia bacterium]|jgi:catechol 2,3-dioxygenase-like lactoylglutathione lyase family enzyme|nr:VOC family protein [Polyangia bacterium]
MLDHIGIKVRDYNKSREFYRVALAPLGYSLLMEFPEQGPPIYAGFGADGKPDFWISQGEQVAPIHFAFVLDDRKAVDAFHAAALKAGAKDNGPPGLRTEYHPNYYGAFVLDPDGNNVEAVCHKP